MKTCIEFTIPSALAPANLPALSKDYEVIWTFYTDVQGAKFLKDSRIIHLLEHSATVVLETSRLNEHRKLTDDKYRLCNMIYSDEMMLAIVDGGIFHWLQPDIILGNTTFSSVARYLRRGYRVGFAGSGFRVERDQIREVLQFFKEGQVININHRSLVKMAEACFQQDRIRDFRNYQAEHGIINLSLKSQILQKTWAQQCLAINMAGLSSQHLNFFNGCSLECSEFFVDVINDYEQICLLDSDDAVMIGVETLGFNESYSQQLNTRVISPSPLLYALFPLMHPGYRFNQVCMGHYWIYRKSSDLSSDVEELELTKRFTQFHSQALTILSLFKTFDFDAVLKMLGQTPMAIRPDVRRTIDANIELFRQK